MGISTPMKLSTVYLLRLRFLFSLACALEPNKPDKAALARISSTCSRKDFSRFMFFLSFGIELTPLEASK